jgi:hypothetical protein
VNGVIICIYYCFFSSFGYFPLGFLGVNQLVTCLETNFTLKKVIVKQNKLAIGGPLQKVMSRSLQRNINRDILQMKFALLMGVHEVAGKGTALRVALDKNKGIADLRPLRHVWQFLWDEQKN